MYSEVRGALYIYLIVYMNQGHRTSDTILKGIANLAMNFSIPGKLFNHACIDTIHIGDGFDVLPRFI